MMSSRAADLLAPAMRSVPTAKSALLVAARSASDNCTDDNIHASHATATTVLHCNDNEGVYKPQSWNSYVRLAEVGKGRATFVKL